MGGCRGLLTRQKAKVTVSVIKILFEAISLSL